MDYGENDADIGTLLQAAGSKTSTKKYIVYTVCPIHKQSKNFFYNFCKIYQGMDGIPFFIDDYSPINNVVLEWISNSHMMWVNHHYLL